ncbi:MAG: hypothetical protein ACE366_29835 [Bradymonadia bacterium]
MNTLKAALTLAPLALSLSACGGAPAGPDMGKLKTKYSERRYVVGHGLGPSQAEAQADAKARVAKQVSASLQADLKVSTQESSGQASTTVDRFIRETSDFERAELIKLVDDANYCGDSGEERCRAMAVMSRGEYLDALAEAYSQQRPAFTEAATGAERSGSDITKFTRNFRVAMDAYTPLATLARRAKVVAGGGIEGMEADNRRARSLIAARASKMSALKITVVPGALQNPKVETAVQRSLVSAISTLGMSGASGESCNDGLAMTLEGQVDCAQGSLGSRCSLPLTARLTDCNTGAELAPLDFRPLKLKGAHPKRMDMALTALIKKAGEAPMADTLRAQLRAVLPLEE